MIVIAVAAVACPAIATNALPRASCPNIKGKYAKAVLKDQPLAYYRLDELTGPTACDSSGNGNAGTYESGITYGVKGALKYRKDKAVSADGTADPVSGPSLPLPGNASFSLEGWYHSTSTNDQMIVDYGHDGFHQVAGVGVWNADLLFIDLYADNMSWDVSPFGIDLRDGTWHLLDATYDSATMTFTGYVDGVMVGSRVNVNAMSFSGGIVRVGWWVDTVYNQPFDGLMDEVAVYAKALAAKRVKAHWKASHHR
jgi:hypothetical protein